MPILNEETAFEIDVLDSEGFYTGRTVMVCIKFTVDIDYSYGANSDGRYGEKRVDTTIEDIFVDPSEAPLLAEELAQVLKEAERRFESVDKFW